jgi:hypothetical protein
VAALGAEREAENREAAGREADVMQAAMDAEAAAAVPEETIARWMA